MEITWKIASLPVERMDIDPNYSVRVLAVVLGVLSEGDDISLWRGELADR